MGKHARTRLSESSRPLAVVLNQSQEGLAKLSLPPKWWRCVKEVFNFFRRSWTSILTVVYFRSCFTVFPLYSHFFKDFRKFLESAFLSWICSSKVSHCFGENADLDHCSITMRIGSKYCKRVHSMQQNPNFGSGTAWNQGRIVETRPRCDIPILSSNREWKKSQVDMIWDLTFCTIDTIDTQSREVGGPVCPSSFKPVSSIQRVNRNCDVVSGFALAEPACLDCSQSFPFQRSGASKNFGP